MDADENPKLYLISPPVFELTAFGDRLRAVLDAFDIACLRLDMASRDADEITRAADFLRDVTTSHDVALVIADHVQLAERLGLDGVHLSDAARSVRGARKALGPDAIVGAYCGASRHDGITAGEAGADYVSFGPLTADSLGDGKIAEPDLFEWWSEMIEIPVVAEGGVTPAVAAALSEATDFFAIGAEIWNAEDPLAALRVLSKAMQADAA